MTSTEYLNHPVHQKVEQLLARLNDKELIEKLEVEKLDFFISACSYLIDRLKVCQPTFMPVSELNTISAEYEAALVQINEFIGNGNIGHINNAVNNINSAVAFIRNIPILLNKSDFDFSKSVTTFQSTLQSKYLQAEKLHTDLEEKIRLTNEKLLEKEEEIKTLNETIISKQTEIQTLTTNFQSQLDTTITNYTKQVSDDRVKFRNEIDLDRDKIKTDTAETLKDLERKLSDATKLVNVIGNVGVTGNYQNIANHHKDTANTWRCIAIAFMCLLSGLLIYSIWKISDPAYDWHKAIIRIIAAAILIYPATYAAKESSKHRQLENSNRKSELELAAINPFIEILDETKKQAIKEKLVEKYFGNNTSGDHDNDKHEIVSVDILEKIVKLITSVSKK